MTNQPFKSPIRITVGMKSRRGEPAVLRPAVHDPIDLDLGAQTVKNIIGVLIQQAVSAGTAAGPEPDPSKGTI